MKIELTPLKVILTGVFIILIMVPIWLYLLFSASPSQTEDYVALYNASNKPANFDESQNAWPLYEQAIATAVTMPSEIQNLVSYKELPTPEQEAEIEKILTANQQTLELLRQAVDKPYCYIELQLEAGESILEDGTLGPGFFRNLAKTISISCLYNISKGNIDQAISDISTCKKLSRHLRLESAMLINQLVGLGIDNLSLLSKINFEN